MPNLRTVSHTQTDTCDIAAVILVGGLDFGRCPLASHLPPALWPVAGRSAVERLLIHWAGSSIRKYSVFSSGCGSLLHRVLEGTPSREVLCSDESLPLGTAGCIREAVRTNGRPDALIVSSGAVLGPPDVNSLLQAHHLGGAELTAMFEPGISQAELMGQSADIYVCGPAVLDHIPESGYFDIKEGLIPVMVRAGNIARAATLPAPVLGFRNRAEYLRAVGCFLARVDEQELGVPLVASDSGGKLWAAPGAEVDRNARIYGPVVAMDGAVISDGAIIFGPAIVERDVVIGRGSLVANSVLWAGSAVGPGCRIEGCVLDSDIEIPSDTVVENQAVCTSHRRPTAETVLHRGDRADCKPKAPGRRKGVTRFQQWAAVAAILGGFLWCYWPEITDLWDIWQKSDEYSSGLLVPFLCLYVLWTRRADLRTCRIKPAFWGLWVLGAGQAVRHFGLFFMYSSAQRFSILVSLAGLVLMLFGTAVFRKVFTLLLFLGLMMPLPNIIHSEMMLPLQSWATSSAAFCLEMMGYAVVREGNILHIGGTTVAVAEACNGLRMVTAFVIITAFVVLLSRRQMWEKVVVLMSSLPVALFCNTVRLTLTAVAFTMLSGEKWEKIFHDFGGYAMVPLALAAVILELQLLSILTVVPAERPSQVFMRRPEGESE